MTYLNQHKTGLALGAVMGLWHFMWSLFVAFGLAKPVLDFILTLHFLNINFEIRDFSVTTAALLVIVTSFLGYAGGFILAWTWNRLAAISH